ncbi:sterol desaturase family protein [Algiphilus sp. W345]|uniref:Sterol desaturase family protein n=1 Tax=Banduia mediterranea TaxID=3075609 RepID=A0ABU2WFI8_9GAMM|nr:sterol desaturase family protein [Algiphilus sp. W345]MDT0496635.1 sterol desaturase family protein [Algiphilus sp. W345]
MAIFAIMSLAETRWPRRPRRLGRSHRWATNLSIMLLGAGVVRLLAALSVPLVAVAVALWAERTQTGLLHWLAWPEWLAFTVSLILLDLLIWAQHAAFHRVPLFWRLHRVHHADREIDASTALRFHPIEIGLSMLIKSAAVLLLGAPALAVMMFEIGLNAMAIFNHTNVGLPERVDRWLRRLLVTPDMHRIHHSIDPREHHRNFGFNLSIWDRLFGSYVASPRLGHLGMQIGLLQYLSDDPGRLWWSLWLPFARANISPESPPANEHEAGPHER